MKRHEESHLDHGLTEAQINYIFAAFKDATGFLLQEITLPEELGKVPCALWGPSMGDPEILNGSEVLPLPEGEYIEPMPHADGPGAVHPIKVEENGRWRFEYTAMITLGKRGTRAYESRLIDLPMRFTRTVTVVAGPSGEGVDDCVLYTAYGGPKAPQEPGDVRRQLEALEEKRRAFHWAGKGDYVNDPDHAKVYAQIEGLRIKRVTSDEFWAKHALSRFAS